MPVKFEIKTSDDSPSSRTPAGVIKKSTLIGAVVGALLVALAGMFFVAIVMIGGAIVGSAAGAVIGVIRAPFALFNRD